MGLNPYVLIGLLIAAIALGAGGYLSGEKNGHNAQKAIDQAQFDKVNADITENKRVANNALIAAQQGIIQIQQQRDAFKQQLGEQHVKDQASTDAIHNLLLNSRLQFTAEVTGRGASGTSYVPSASNPSGDNGTAVCQLPTTIEGNLRQLTLDADNLRNDYKELYDFNHP